ncbi:protein shisa-2 homolog [Rhinatrema bivittatum]|uniref:protein shisa-2 homolog n=1 Tax=Rhinatrema bivittatum TaxID=194408 RepID=UPI0011261D4A|nr:protein shisa-2 homolog [Rhinatrema bivittatum]
MVRAGLLLLLVGPWILGVLSSGARQLAGSGEYCHGWTDGHRLWHEGFRCPERYDAPAATLCCGSCNLRYCCATGETRLDQGVCYNDNVMGLATEGQVSRKNAAVPMYLPFLLVTGVFVTFVVAGSLLGLCCCCGGLGREGEAPPGGPVHIPEPPPPELVN